MDSLRAVVAKYGPVSPGAEEAARVEAEAALASAHPSRLAAAAHEISVAYFVRLRRNQEGA